MKKNSAIYLIALSFLILGITKVSADSQAKQERGFSCTEKCTVNIATCDDYQSCKAHCTKKGGFLSRIRGREVKVTQALKKAELKKICEISHNPTAAVCRSGCITYMKNFTKDQECEQWAFCKKNCYNHGGEIAQYLDAHEQQHHCSSFNTSSSH